MTPRLALCSLLLVAVGCVGGEAKTGAVASAGVVQGTISWAGGPGTLRVAVFPSFPPRGAPIAEVAIDAPARTQEYAIPGVPPGRYFVLAFVDGTGAGRERYRPALDHGGAFGGYLTPHPVTVDATLGAQHVDLELSPPDPTSPWR